jgi:hypothetical protein
MHSANAPIKQQLCSTAQPQEAQSMRNHTNMKMETAHAA